MWLQAKSDHTVNPPLLKKTQNESPIGVGRKGREPTTATATKAEGALDQTFPSPEDTQVRQSQTPSVLKSMVLLCHKCGGWAKVMLQAKSMHKDSRC